MTSTSGLAGSYFARLPNELYGRIFNPENFDTVSKYRLSQTCRRLRAEFLGDTRIEFLLASIAEELGVRLCARRRIFHLCLSLIAYQSPSLAVCENCIDVHDIMNVHYELPSIIKPEREKLLALRPLDAPRRCIWRTVGPRYALRRVSGLTPDHLNMQLALKYHRLQKEDPELLRSVPDWFIKHCLEPGMWPMLRFTTVPASTRRVKCYMNWYPQIVRQRDGQPHYIVRIYYYQKSCITSKQDAPEDAPEAAPEDAPEEKRRMPALRLFSRARSPPAPAPAIDDANRVLPLTSEDIIPYSFCPHQIIGPQDVSPEMAEDATSSGCRFKAQQILQGLRRRREPQPIPEPVAPSSYTHNLVHQALSDLPSEESLYTSCTLCSTDIAVRALHGGRVLQVITWRDLGPEQSAANIYWQSQILGPSQFFGEEPSTLYQTGYFGENRGDEGLVKSPLHQAGSIRELYEGELARAEAEAEEKAEVEEVEEEEAEAEAKSSKLRTVSRELMARMKMRIRA